jgi:hypothetical protein
MIDLPKALTSLSLLCGFTIAAWLRFDQRTMLWSWLVAIASLATLVAGQLLNAKRAPTIVLPAELEELSNKPELTPEESARFSDGLRAWHQERQQEDWREIIREGPWVIVAHRATMFYFWATLLVLMIVPPVVPRGIFSAVPRFVLVLFPIAVIAFLLAVPLGLRDWRRVRRSAGITP